MKTEFIIWRYSVYSRNLASRRCVCTLLVYSQVTETVSDLSTTRHRRRSSFFLSWTRSSSINAWRASNVYLLSKKKWIIRLNEVTVWKSSPTWAPAITCSEHLLLLISLIIYATSSSATAVRRRNEVRWMVTRSCPAPGPWLCYFDQDGGL